MKRISITFGILVAIAIAAGAAMLQTAAAAIVLGARGSVTIAVAFAVLAYGFVLVERSERPIGRVAVALFLLTGQFGAFLLGASAGSLALLGAAQLWLSRSFLFRRGILASLIDGGLIVLGIGAAAGALRAGYGVFGVVWSFLLVQSLFVLIPNTVLRRSAHEGVHQEEDAFHRAFHAAEQALHRL